MIHFLEAHETTNSTSTPAPVDQTLNFLKNLKSKHPFQCLLSATLIPRPNKLSNQQLNPSLLCETLRNQLQPKRKGSQEETN